MGVIGLPLARSMIHPGASSV